MRTEEVIRRPLMMTEKGSLVREESNRYTFEVHLQASKRDVAAAVEELFRVSVKEVNTLVTRGKTKKIGRRKTKTRNQKKAFVKIADGETIDVFGPASN